MFYIIELNDNERTPCEIWSRVMGYHRPVESWNSGKQQEHSDRLHFKENILHYFGGAGSRP